MTEQRNPTQEEVRSIMNEVYNIWFTKYKNSETDEQFQNMVKDAHIILKKYPFELCEVMLLKLSNAIEAYYKERKR